MLDLIIAGGGPAGLTAAVYAVRQRLSVLLVSPQLGGRAEMRSEFSHLEAEGVIRGQELVSRFRNELSYLEIAHRTDSVQRVRGKVAEGGKSPTGSGFVVETSGGEALECRALVVATGCRFQAPQLPGAAKYLLKGIGYSAASYAHLFLDRRAVVIGSGIRAVRSALRLAHSASRVYLLPEEGKDLGPALASPEGQTLSGTAGVTALPDCRVAGFNGERFATEVLITRADESTDRIAADGFFLEGEALPNSGMVAELVKRDTAGHIRVDGRSRTSCEGIFAAGDVTDVHREQVLVAVGEGAKASLSAQEFLFARDASV
jgi:alkyl hydroperoxide reductase subunit F